MFWSINVQSALITVEADKKAEFINQKSYGLYTYQLMIPDQSK